MTHDLAEPHSDALNGVADATPTVEAIATPGDISAREAIRRVVADLGADAELDDVLAQVQTKFGLSPPRGTAQSYFCLARRDARDGIPNEPRRRGRPRKTPGNPASNTAPVAAIDEVIEAIELLRDLCDRLGDDNIRRLLDTL